MRSAVVCRICPELYDKIEKVQKEMGIPFVDASRIVASDTHITIDIRTRRTLEEILG